VLVDIEQLTGDEVVVEAGSVLALDDDERAQALFVVAGELALRLEDVTQRVEPETWIFVPAGVPASAAADDEPARVLRLRVASAGRGRDVVITRAGGAEGETIGGRRPDRRATLLVDTAELTVTEFAYGPDMRGADLHVHHTHADAFFVLEGELAVRHRDGVLSAPAGTITVIPPDVVHGFDNGPVSSRFFNLHMPASGFADYLRGRNPDFDQHDPPPDGGVDPTAIVVAHVGQ
jgi:quercetin dioxygenase-like cupin family protein